ncbi:MAG: hypothetical protein F9B45_15665 [Phycisphaera sp. RhM]|nr:hypothetical protein [Phycisphaera sp. RhM]
MEKYVLLLRATIVAALLYGSACVDDVSAQQTSTPTVQWTVRDAPDFRYPFLETVKTTTLLHGTPETGTFNLHGDLIC